MATSPFTGTLELGKVEFADWVLIRFLPAIDASCVNAVAVWVCDGLWARSES